MVAIVVHELPVMTDSSPQICELYAKQDARIKLIHKENGGLSDTRNTGNSVLITIVTVVLSILIHSMIGYVIGRSKSTSKFYKVAYLYIVSGMFVPFAILMMPLVKQTAQMGIDNILVGLYC